MKYFVVYENKANGTRYRKQVFKSRRTAEGFCNNSPVVGDTEGYVIDEWEVVFPGVEEKKISYRLMIMKLDGNLMEKYFESYDDCIGLAKKSMEEGLCNSYMVEKIEE